VCIDPHQTGFVGKSSDHLQLIKFPCPQEGSLLRGEIYGSILLQPVHSVCISSEGFFIMIFYIGNNVIGRGNGCKLVLFVGEVLWC